MPDDAAAERSTTILALRIHSIDMLRGVAIVLMTLDHARDFMNRDAFLRNPTDLTTTTPIIFLTRGVTHFCAPTFVFLAGLSVCLQLNRGKPKAEVARWLVYRGLFLIALELIVLRPLIWFNLDYSFITHLQVIWVIGWSMIVLAGLIWLPVSLVAVMGVLVVGGHHALDLVPIPRLVQSAPDAILALLHEDRPILIHWPFQAIVFNHYPMIPWVAVMALGYVLGGFYRWPTSRRRAALTGLGWLILGLFVVLRWSNVYRDPNPWVVPAGEAVSHLNDWQRVVFSFVNTEKYPPSLQFLCMTLGPALVILGVLDSREPGWFGRRMTVFGAVPLFFYVLQWPTLHLMSRLFQWMAGQPVGWDGYYPFADDYAVPEGTGFSIGVTYLGWILSLVLLYPLCSWFAGYKRRNPRRGWLAFF